MSVPRASIDPRAALARLRTQLSGVANDLFRLEAEPELQTAMNPDWVAGETAALLGDHRDLVPSLWERYPEVAAAVDEVAGAVDANDLTRASALLAPGGWPRAGAAPGTIAEMLADLRRDTGAVLVAAERIAAARRDARPRLDAAASEVARIAAMADDIDADGEPAVRAAEQLIESYGTLATTDPLAVDLTALDRAVERARTRVEGAVVTRQQLAQRMAAARALVDDLAVRIVEGQEALAETRAKVAGTDGLLEPLRQAQVDAGPHGVTPWLERLEALVDRGQWEPLAEGLARWEPVAQGWMRNADAVVAANRAPLARRDELRGLLDAYASKATAVRTFEHPEVAQLYRQAADMLAGAPCPLDEAAELVARYGRAVSGARKPTSPAGR